MEKNFFEAISRGGHPLSTAVIRGAQLMLQKGLEWEVSEFLGRGHYQRGSGDKPVMGYRSGYEDRKLQTGEGTLHLKVPQVRDTLEAFESVWLPSLCRRSEKLTALIPQLYVKGLSTRDVEAALTEALEVEGVGRNAVSQVCREIRGQFEAWQNRDLSKEAILYLLCDGIYLKLRTDDPKPVAVLCAYGIRDDGAKVLLHLATGDKESAACWKSFFQDMKGRGLAEPFLAVIDGNSGLRKAVRECFPGAWVQRGQVHKMRNILCKLPQKTRAGIKKLIQKAFTAKSYQEGVEQARGIIAMYQEQFPEAMKCLGADLEECLTALKLPEAHRKRIRTTNLLERLFGEGRRRSKVIPRFTSEASGLSLMFAVLWDASENWRGVRITAETVQHIRSLRQVRADQDTEERVA
jgi:transposase-like protein